MEKLVNYDKSLAAGSYFLLGNIYFGQKQYSDSESAYRKSLDLNPQFGQTYYNLGIVCASRGDRECAKFCMEKYLELMPGSEKETDARKLLKELSK
jgi:tetratricopeptide (TPR) repeat protein